MAIDPERVKALFLKSIERSDPTDRRAFLDAEVGGNAELRERLEALLAAYDQPLGALDRPMGANPEATDAFDASRPTTTSPLTGATAGGRMVSRTDDNGPSLIETVVADRYKLRQEIGEGGMGTVFMAEQLRPVRRMVALKLIKPGMDSRQVLARFESERQALALMEHPNIARVLDAGTTADGRPFFVMELVKGLPITEYCDLHRLDLTARLNLFRQVCHAVQHAHQKGIIHRDLKPSNILVEAHDDKPVPKVIDFGLAKATSGMRLSEQSLFTAFGSVAGTPLYMAPEQANWSALDTDTRADIYALGVILYELLTGTTPIARESMQRAAIDEMLRLIREHEPPTPSSRLSTAETLASLAATRQVEPTRLARLVRGELDWITMKALAKERDRRYATAASLAEDLANYLNHEPVTAGPPTAAYRLRKFVRRNRLQVAAAALVLLALVAGVVGTTLGLIEARRQEKRARKQEALALEAAAESERARAAEANQRKLAETRLAQVTKMSEILGSIFKDLDLESAVKEGKPITAALGERLDRATEEIEGEATGDPLGVARLQVSLGHSQLSLGYAERAAKLFAKARSTFTAELGPDDPNTLMSMSNLSICYANSGQHERAIQLGEELLLLQRAKLGRDHLLTLGNMRNLADYYRRAGYLDRALRLYEETLALTKAKLGADHPHTISSIAGLASSYATQGKNDQALRLRQEVLTLAKAKLGADHPQTLTSMQNLANSYEAVGQTDRALRLREETLTLQKRKLGLDHPDTLQSMCNMAISYEAVGQTDRAIKLYEETLALQKARLGPDHPTTLITRCNLAISYANSGQTARAIRLYEEALALQKAKLGLDHPDTLITMINLAANYASSGRTIDALKLGQEVLGRLKAKLGPDHPATLTSMSNLADSYAQSGQTDRAVKLLEETVALAKAKLGPDHPQTISFLNDQAQCLANVGQLERAAQIFDQVIALRRKIQGDGHPGVLAARMMRARLELARGRLEAAEAANRAILEECRARLGTDDRTTIYAELALAQVRQDRGDRNAAAPLYRTALESSRKHPTDSNTLATALTESGRSRLAACNWSAAEAQLRESLTIREVEMPQHWTTAESRSLLGGALLGQKRTADAVPLLRSGYEGMALSAFAIPWVDRRRLAEALDRLIAAGEAAGTKAEVAAWKAEQVKLATGQPKL